MSSEVLFIKFFFHKSNKKKQVPSLLHQDILKRISFNFYSFSCNQPSKVYLFKVINKNTWLICWMLSRTTSMTPLSLNLNKLNTTFNVFATLKSSRPAAKVTLISSETFLFKETFWRQMLWSESQFNKSLTQQHCSLHGGGKLQNISIHCKVVTAQKVPEICIFLVRIFPYFDWMQRFTL